MNVRGKRNIGRKILAVALSVCMLLTVQPNLWDGVMVQAAEVVNGTLDGTNLAWTLANGVMTISGSGAMTDFTYGNYKDSPFYLHRNSIKKLSLKMV